MTSVFQLYFNGGKSLGLNYYLFTPIFGLNQDIKFMEELKESGFTKTAVVALVSNSPFYEGRSNQGIYRYFREEYRVYGEIYKPTGAMKGKESIVLKGQYNFKWQSLEDNKKYFMIEI